MFKTNNQLKDELATAQSKISELEADASAQAQDLETAQTELATTREDLTAAQARIAELETENTAHAEKITNLETDLEAQKEATEQAKNSAGAQAASEIANAGHPPVEVVEEAEELTIKQQYAAMAPGPDRKAFRDKHAAELAAQ